MPLSGGSSSAASSNNVVVLTADSSASNTGGGDGDGSAVVPPTISSGATSTGAIKNQIKKSRNAGGVGVGNKRVPPTTMTAPVAVSPPSSTAITIEPPQQQSSTTTTAAQHQKHLHQHQARAVSATSCTSEESEESVPDSWEEGRAPLLRRSPRSPLADDDEWAAPSADDRTAGHEGVAGGTAVADAAAAADAAASPKGRRRIPRERRKAGYAFLMLVFCGTLNDIVLSYIHELVPETPPLPDIAFTYLPYWPWALVVSECLMITMFFIMMLIAVLHKHRWVVLRRIFLIGSLLYLGRCVTMFVTQVPVADTNYYCSPRLKPEQRTFWNILARALSVVVGLGLKINGRHTLCGDYIYSGHTIVHVTCCLFIREYSPRRWRLLHLGALCLASVGVLSLLFSRGHYSIDVIIAYWVATRLFWIYHTLADLPALRNELQGRNHLTKTVWYRLFLWMEGGVQRPIPRKYELPFTIPAQLRRCWRRRRSNNGTHENDRDRDRLID